MNKLTVDGVRFSILFSAEDIHSRVAGVAREIVSAVGPAFLVIPVLKGSFIFAADLLRALHHADATPDMDFLGLSSYGTATQSSGKVSVTRDTEARIEGRDVLIIDDILESGRTLSFAKEMMQARGARSVRTCVLLEKPGKRIVDITPDFVGFHAPDRFVVGYGMDAEHAFRQLPFIGVVEA